MRMGTDQRKTQKRGLRAGLNLTVGSLQEFPISLGRRHFFLLQITTVRNQLEKVGNCNLQLLLSWKYKPEENCLHDDVGDKTFAYLGV